jgi:hypothetical protein
MRSGFTLAHHIAAFFRLSIFLVSATFPLTLHGTYFDPISA